MKAYQLYFIGLKVLILFQFVMVILKKQSKDSDMYILTDTAFKASAGLYLILFFIIHHFPGLEFEDTVILRFSGVIILFDIDYTGFLTVLAKYSPWLSERLSFLEAIKG